MTMRPFSERRYHRGNLADYEVMRTQPSYWPPRHCLSRRSVNNRIASQIRKIERENR